MNPWKRGLGVLGACFGTCCVLTAALVPGSVKLVGIPLPVLVLLLCFGINLLAWVPASLAEQERNFDVTGTWTFLSATGLCLFAAAASGALDARRALVAVLVLVWAGRLGDMLYHRVRRDGGDGRFDDLKTHPGRFLVPWSLQATWVVLTLLAATAVWSRASVAPDLGGLDAVGLVLWGVGFGVEVVADQQKHAFRSDSRNRDRFVDTGLWAWSRHPNYFGEILLWVGVFVIAIPVLSAWSWLALLSPVFVGVLLTQVSGVPLLEARADARWGEDVRYQAYKERTPVLVPRRPRH